MRESMVFYDFYHVLFIRFLLCEVLSTELIHSQNILVHTDRASTARRRWKLIYVSRHTTHWGIYYFSKLHWTSALIGLKRKPQRGVSFKKKKKRYQNNLWYFNLWYVNYFSSSQTSQIPGVNCTQVAAQEFSQQDRINQRLIIRFNIRFYCYVKTLSYPMLIHFSL